MGLRPSLAEIIPTTPAAPDEEQPLEARLIPAGRRRDGTWIAQDATTHTDLHIRWTAESVRGHVWVVRLARSRWASGPRWTRLFQPRRLLETRSSRSKLG
ncbi:MAG TPA: hypothetical protein VM534_02300 [Thermoanaerobaculia bacterium]|nr:hypothetical protein [Thermoanaerobaculia bacterium]